MEGLGCGFGGLVANARRVCARVRRPMYSIKAQTARFNIPTSYQSSAKPCARARVCVGGGGELAKGAGGVVLWVRLESLTPCTRVQPVHSPAGADRPHRRSPIGRCGGGPPARTWEMYPRATGGGRITKCHASTLPPGEGGGGGASPLQRGPADS